MPGKSLGPWIVHEEMFTKISLCFVERNSMKELYSYLVYYADGPCRQTHGLKFRNVQLYICRLLLLRALQEVLSCVSVYGLARVQNLHGTCIFTFLTFGWPSGCSIPYLCPIVPLVNDSGCMQSCQLPLILRRRNFRLWWKCSREPSCQTFNIAFFPDMPDSRIENWRWPLHLVICKSYWMMLERVVLPHVWLKLNFQQSIFMWSRAAARVEWKEPFV
jgi:hypothetical protein